MQVTVHKIFLVSAVLLFGCGGGGDDNTSAASNNPSTPSANNAEYSAFSTPERVAIVGYTGDAMEPFLSRDGQFLFFNSNENNPNNKDLYYASYIDDTHFTYIGEVLDINTGEVDGVASMDNTDNFFWISTSAYTPPTTYDTIFSGTFNRNTGEISGKSAVTGLSESIDGHLNFDLEISPDGYTLYFVDGIFSGAPHPDEGNIAVATRTDTGFSRDPNSDIIFTNINTDDLEYAPAVSENGLELFFTRMNLDDLQPTTFRATRSRTTDAFQTPQKISAITGFAEAATYSPDEKSLYYHKLDGSTFVIYRITRP